MSVPRLRAYARETVVSEKFQAMVHLGMANSWMKDRFDLWIISQAFEIDQSRLAAAIARDGVGQRAVDNEASPTQPRQFCSETVIPILAGVASSVIIGRTATVRRARATTVRVGLCTSSMIPSCAAQEGAFERGTPRRLNM